MSARSHRGERERGGRRNWRFRVGWLSAGAVLLLACAAAQGAAPNAAILEEHLAAGEFGGAIALAEAAPDAQTRDLWLEAVAAAQARAGARGASFATLREVVDDRVRSRGVQTVAAEPLGRGGRPGGVQADFDPLIDLITSTVQPDSWDENGGEGAIEEFRGGIHVDAEGIVHRVTLDDSSALRDLRAESAGGEAAAGDVRRSSPLRKVSLTRLEREVQFRLAQGLPLDDEMLVLGGLRRIEYVFVYPETGDLVVAGPAGDWYIDREGRIVNAEDGRPIVRLDDLVVLLRHAMTSPEMVFGCSIDPTREGLADAQAYLDQTSGQPLKPGQRDRWLEGLRSRVGMQTVSLSGIDPTSRVARILVEADYHMKLVGIGLEEGTLDVPSYLELVRVPKGQAPPPLDVLRWWFTLNYKPLLVTDDRDAFELRGQGVKVQCENELLDRSGERAHTGAAGEWNLRFARNFTSHFEALAVKYPLYTELRNVFDLAVTTALIRAEKLDERVGWHMTFFGDADQFLLPGGEIPRSVETVINHRVINRVHVVAAVSGGVHVDAGSAVVGDSIEVDTLGRLGSDLDRAAPESVPRQAWWWD